MFWKVLAAISLAILAGWLTGPDSELFGITYVRIFGLIGQLFLNALSLVVVPLVASSIISGTARMGSEQSFGTLGLKTFGYFIATSFCAIVVGIIFTLLLDPGVAREGNASLVIHQSQSSSIETAANLQGDGFQKIEQILLKIVPANILATAAQGQMLGIIFFCILFGYFISKVDPHSASILLSFWKGIFQIMMAITQLVMKALPLGVFGLVAKVIATTGLDSIRSVALFAMTEVIALSAYLFIVLPLMLKFIAHVNPISHFRAMLPALITAFSTSSSAGTLPITIECVEKKAGVSNRVSSFVLPLGTALNQSGTALYQCVAVLFIAQVYGIDLGVGTLALVLTMSLLTSFGMAGIPSASLIAIVVILHSIGLPADGIGLIMAVERILDMCRTSVNVFGHSCCAVLVARSEGERDILITPEVAYE